MSQAQHIADRYIAAWNETDADRRMALLGEDWTDDAAYVDPLAKVAGRGEIAAMMDSVQTRFPGFRFALSGRPDGHGDQIGRAHV